MNWIWALLVGGGLYVYSKNKSSAATSAAKANGLNGAAQALLAQGNATTAQTIADLNGGVNGINSLGTSIKGLFSSPSAKMPSINNSPAAAASDTDEQEPEDDPEVDEEYFTSDTDPFTGTLG